MTTAKLQLPNCTLIALTGLGYKTAEHVEALNKSCEDIDFWSVKLIQLAEIVDVETWNDAITQDLWKHFDTDYCLLIHSDGYIIHPELWNDKWLTFDYGGSPWPLPTDEYSYRDVDGNIIRVGNSVGLRSRKLMQRIAQLPNDMHYGNNNEDGNICCWHRKELEAEGFTFMPFKEALTFGREIDLPEHNGRDTFLFHSI